MFLWQTSEEAIHILHHLDSSFFLRPAAQNEKQPYEPLLGEMAAKEMLTMLHDTGNSPQESLEVGILLSSDASQAMVNRVSGFLDYWAKYAPTKWEITKDIA